MPGIFISYRREDSPGYAGRLAETLENVFGSETVFRDVDDIRPGEDFIATINNRLREVDAVLVMIGPNWLAASKNGQRRLDDADDFVRLEIQVALQSGKTVLPVLVSGSAMPAQAELPEALRALARRQAVVLTDAGWRDDVGRLIVALRPLVSSRRRFWRGGYRPWALATGLLALLGGLYAVPWPGARPPPVVQMPEDMARPEAVMPPAASALAEVPPAPLSTPAPEPAKTPKPEPSVRRAAASPKLAVPATPPSPPAADIAGRWRATIRYDWGAEHEESFDLKPEEGEVFGTASYLRTPRIIEQGELRGERLRFVTRTQVVYGNEAPLDLTHRYRGKVTPEAIHFVLESTGGYGGYAPVEFVARRVDE
jgi:hypothetical protein